MKTYEEMARCALARGNILRKQRNKTRQILVGAGAVLVLCCLVILLFGGNGKPGGATEPIHMGGEPTVGQTEGTTLPGTDPTMGQNDATQPAETEPTGGQPQEPVNVPLTSLLSAPTYPEMLKKPNSDGDSLPGSNYYEAYLAWRENQKQQYDQPDGYADSLSRFFHASMEQYLQGEENPTYSPLNVYMAMAMLAETTDGNSRRQILDLFGLETIEQLREQASYVWNAHYNNDGETTLQMANSLWLDQEFSFHNAVTQRLAEHYYASAFHGDLGTENMNKQLQTWLNENTGGLLQKEAQKVRLEPGTAFALASTVYFSAGWVDAFLEKNTWDEPFYGPDGEQMVPVMHGTFSQLTYYWGSNFSAVALELTGENRMWLILPNRGHTVQEILSGDEYLRMTLNPEGWGNKRVYKIHLSLPKFDVSDQKDLISGMKAMGVTDIFSGSTSDFTPMTDTRGLFVGQINHAARVAIDEEGCIAAAFTVIAAEADSAPPELDELDFVLDRPFLFVVSSRDNLPLFTGVVNQP